LQNQPIARGALLAFSFVAFIFALRPAAALEKVKVRIPATEAFSFMAVDFGKDLGIYERNGIEVERVDLVIKEFSADGKFDARALKVMARSFVELGQLDREPDLTKYYI
jgi:ABC-type nitrate/sulfonate/bicarbonate transport system substrate-binding protein